jgi:alanine racemase
MLYPEMNLDAVRIGSCIQGRVLINNLNLRKIGIFKSEIITIKDVPKGYNISYSNEYKTKKAMKIAVVPVRIYGWI